MLLLKERHFHSFSELRPHVTPHRPCHTSFQPLRTNGLSKPNICFSLQCNYSVCYWGQMVVNQQIINVAGHSLFLALERSQGVKFPLPRLVRCISFYSFGFLMYNCNWIAITMEKLLIKPFSLKKKKLFLQCKNDTTKRWLVSITCSCHKVWMLKSGECES